MSFNSNLVLNPRFSTSLFFVLITLTCQLRRRRATWICNEHICFLYPSQWSLTTAGSRKTVFWLSRSTPLPRLVSRLDLVCCVMPLCASGTTDIFEGQCVPHSTFQIGSLLLVHVSVGCLWSRTPNRQTREGRFIGLIPPNIFSRERLSWEVNMELTVNTESF